MEVLQLDKKGTILELKKDYCTIMTEDCKFEYIKRSPGMFVGQQINFANQDIMKFRNNIFKYIGLVASFLAIILISIMSYYKFNSNKNIYAYVDIDINPSLEVVINKDNNVLSVKPINEDGKMLLKNLKLKGKTLKIAIGEILDQSRNNGYIKSQTDNYVLIATSLNPETIEYKRDLNEEEKKLNNLLNSFKGITEENGKEKIITKVINTTWETRKLANENNISTGKYFMYSKAKDMGLNFSIDEVRNSNISEILKKIKTDSSNDKTKDVNSTDPAVASRTNNNVERPEKKSSDSSLTPAQDKNVNNTPVISQIPAWNVGVNYTIGTVISYKNNNYKCIQAHLSQSDWQPSNVPALWQKQVTIDSNNTWQTAVSYTVGTLVTYNGINYKCIQAHKSLQGWEPPNVPALWQKS